jgi:hypothetical protein
MRLEVMTRLAADADQEVGGQFQFNRGGMSFRESKSRSARQISRSEPGKRAIVDMVASNNEFADRPCSLVSGPMQLRTVSRFATFASRRAIRRVQECDASCPLPIATLPLPIHPRAHTNRRVSSIARAGRA